MSIIVHTLEYSLHLGHFCRIIEFPELLSLLCQILSLYQRVTLVSYEVGRSIVKCGHQGSEIDICTLSVQYVARNLT